MTPDEEREVRKRLAAVQHTEDQLALAEASLALLTERATAEAAMAKVAEATAIRDAALEERDAARSAAEGLSSSAHAGVASATGEVN
jgi:hypothetical protein